MDQGKNAPASTIVGWLTGVRDRVNEHVHLRQSGARVEHPFRVLKRQFGHAKVRYRGMAKNTAQLPALFTLANLWLVRRKLLAALA